MSTTTTPTPATIQEVVDKFNTLDDALKIVFSKVDPRTVVGLIIRGKTEKKPIYTLETVIKPDQNIDSIRRDILNVTGMAPGFLPSEHKDHCNTRAGSRTLEADKRP